jgi:hypothetical protein
MNIHFTTLRVVSLAGSDGTNKLRECEKLGYCFQWEETGVCKGRTFHDHEKMCQIRAQSISPT